MPASTRLGFSWAPGLLHPTPPWERIPSPLLSSPRQRGTHLQTHPARPASSKRCDFDLLKQPPLIFLVQRGCENRLPLIPARVLKPQTVISLRPISFALSLAPPDPSVASQGESGQSGPAPVRPPATASPVVRQVSMSVFLSFYRTSLPVRPNGTSNCSRPPPRSGTYAGLRPYGSVVRPDITTAVNREV